MSSVMRRMKDISIATLNDKLDRAEDPVRVIDQFLHGQRQQIQHAEQLHGQMMKHAAYLKGQYKEAELMLGRREEQALLALKAGEEHVAKMALQEKMVQQEKMQQYQVLYEESKASILEIEAQLERLRSEHQDVLSKRQFYAARMESLRLQWQMNESIRSHGQIGTAFQRLEDRISDMELESKCLRDVKMIGHELVHAGAAIQQSIERELDSLKKKLEQEGWMKR